MFCHTASEQFTVHSYKYWFYLLLACYFCLVTLHTNKTSPLANITSLVEMYRHTECTVNAAVLLYTHHKVVASVMACHLYGEEVTSITLIMCTTNNCLVERASTSLEESPKTGPYAGGLWGSYQPPSRHWGSWSIQPNCCKAVYGLLRARSIVFSLHPSALYVRLAPILL